MIACIIQVRMGSTRFPGKVMKELVGYPMLGHVVERCRLAKKVDLVVVATTKNPEDDIVDKFCKENDIAYFRGSADDVLARYYKTARQFNSKIIVRVTSDCPLIDPVVIDSCIKKFEDADVDYLSNILWRTFPRGLDVEVLSFQALERAHQTASESYEREHVTPYIWENKKGEFRIGPMVTARPEYARSYRLTVDYPEDFELMKKIYDIFYREGKVISVPEVLIFLDAHPEVAGLNAHCEQRPLR